MNYIECLDIAAAKLGKDELAIDIKFAFEDKHYELMQTAAELYAHLSNSHKHGVMQAEGSDVRDGAAVGQPSVDTGVSVGCPHPRHKRTYIGEGYLRCGECGEEFK